MPITYLKMVTVVTMMATSIPITMIILMPRIMPTILLTTMQKKTTHENGTNWLKVTITKINVFWSL
jgi:hypothetical protein